MDMAVILPTTDMDILTMDMADTVATPITEVPTGAVITMDTITDIMPAVVIFPAVDIIPKLIIATEEWIAGNMQVTPGLPGLLKEVLKELPEQIPGTGAAPAVKVQPKLHARIQQLEALERTRLVP